MDIVVEPTAISIGNARLDYQQIYLLLAILFGVIAIVLAAYIVHYARKIRAARARFEEIIRDAEESVRRGFAVLRRDIELELATIVKAKLKGEISVEEK